MEKIEKLEGSYDVPQLKQKLNEIIDYLNTQPQTEEKECECCKWDDMGYTHEPYCPLFKEYKQDTPEEWRELFAEWGLWSLVEDISDDGDGQGDNLQLTKEGREAYRMIKGLLSEREREVLNSMREWVVEYHKDNWDIRDFDAEIAIGKIIDRELSKLNK